MNLNELNSLQHVISQQIDDSIRLKEHLKNQSEILVKVATEITEAYQKGNKVLLFGNGGSAGDAEHIATELLGKFYKERNPLPAIALTTNTLSITAIANDYGYEKVFARQVQALAVEGDIVIGISTSGNSANVVSGLKTAKELGMRTVALVGKGGKITDIADYIISFPSTDTPRIQEAHITAGHIICYLVEEIMEMALNPSRNER